MNEITSLFYYYGPFGEVIRATGPMAKLNPFRFSTKYDDDESDFLYYGYRYFNPSTGRWLSRDPILDFAFEEKLNPSTQLLDRIENANEYLFVHNSGLSDNDILGLCDMVTSGSGTVSGTGWTAFKHHPFPFIHTKSPPVTDTFSLTCPSSKPYLVIYGLGSSGNSPFFDDFPSGWGVYPSGGPGTYTFSVSVPSRLAWSDHLGQLSGLYIQGCCSCKSIGAPERIDPKAPPPFPDDPPPPYYPYPGAGPL